MDPVVPPVPQPAPVVAPAAPAAATAPSGLTIRPIPSNQAAGGSNTPSDAPAAAAVELAPAAEVVQPEKFRIAEGLEFESPEAAALAFRAMQGRQQALDRREAELNRAEQPNPEAETWFKRTKNAALALMRSGQTAEQVSQTLGVDVRQAFPKLVAAVQQQAEQPQWDPRNPWDFTAAEENTFLNALVEDPSGKKTLQLQNKAISARLAHMAEGVAPILQERAQQRQEKAANDRANQFYQDNIPAAADHLTALIDEAGQPLYPTLQEPNALHAFFQHFAHRGYDPTDPNDLEQAAAAFESPAYRKRARIEVSAGAARTAVAPVTVQPSTARVVQAPADMTVGGQAGAVAAGSTPATGTQPVRIFGEGRPRSQAETLLGHKVQIWPRRTA